MNGRRAKQLRREVYGAGYHWPTVRSRYSWDRFKVWIRTKVGRDRERVTQDVMLNAGPRRRYRQAKRKATR